MRSRLTRCYRFEAAHRLPRVPEGHKCARMHGHSYEVSIVVEGEIGSATGWVMDFAEIDTAVRPIIDQLDHRVLNEIEGLENPTCENLSVWMAGRIRSALPELAELIVSETRDSSCTLRFE